MPIKLPPPSEYTPDFVLVDAEDENLATGSVLTRVAAREDGIDPTDLDALLARYLVDAPEGEASSSSSTESTELRPVTRPPGSRRDR